MEKVCIVSSMIKDSRRTNIIYPCNGNTSLAWTGKRGEVDCGYGPLGWLERAEWVVAYYSVEIILGPY